jgi:hypothetical protein
VSYRVKNNFFPTLRKSSAKMTRVGWVPAKTTEGKTLFENLSVEQLRAQAPEIHELIRTAVASGSGQPDVVIDASVRPTR